MHELESEYHIPVLYYESLETLVTKKDGIYVDCTLGGGGHSEGILREIGENGRLISIDQDDQAIEFAKKRLQKYGEKWSVFKNNFENIQTVLYMAGVDKVTGILMDIGVSSTQLDDPERGFSYRYDTRLDMRMNRSSELSAYEVVNDYEEGKLVKIFFEYGEDRFARKVARLICQRREEKPIETTGELVDIIRKAYPPRSEKHPAKKVFQAIRIEVNRELEVLQNAITKCFESLEKGGRLGIITFHSLEDRIVKNMFRDLCTGCKCPIELPICMCNEQPKGKLVNKKPIISGQNELNFNNRAHSAKLRVIEKL
ncbi:MAG: 16S rRNA (cytosine(1402)-N(4))-methyltransferase RsmH [Cetobacterium sp.]|uniref:16S rRNA (cytosine(1402)-N(4))-methyltransferase RsmH n=1 Tax=Cetobacterium sp. TaxID=2071632 RepID=UPI003F3255A7